MTLPDLSNSTRVPPISDNTKGSSQQPLIPSISKEKEFRVSEEKILEEVRKGIEVEISKEVKDAGVKEIKETIDLPEKVAKQTGVIQVGEGVLINTKPTLKLPLDDQKIKQAIKKNKIVDSILWLAYWCLRQIEVAKFRALKFLKIQK